jgi:PPOX class probable F420-dependent enzyme
MVNQRQSIELTSEEQQELIAGSRVMQVASINPDGRPHLVPMWFELDDDGAVVFTTYGRSQKIQNLERDARITLLFETGEAYNEIRGLSIDATAEVIRDPHVTAATLALIGAKHAGRPRPTAPPEGEPPPVAHKRVTVRIPIHGARVRSWDHRKL